MAGSRSFLCGEVYAPDGGQRALAQTEDPKNTQSHQDLAIYFCVVDNGPLSAIAISRAISSPAGSVPDCRDIQSIASLRLALVRGERPTQRPSQVAAPQQLPPDMTPSGRSGRDCPAG